MFRDQKISGLTEIKKRETNQQIPSLVKTGQN